MRPRKHDRHLPGSVYKRHGAYYLVRQGKWIALGKDLKSALAEYARKTQQTEGSMPQLIDRALDARKAEKGYAANTWKDYQLMARQLKSIFAEFNPEDVQPRHIAQVRLKFADRPGMANRALSILKVTFEYCVAQQLIDSNPAIGIKRVDEPERERIISADEYARIREKATPQLQVVMDLCAITGQRISDVIGIKYADITDAGISFRQQKTGNRLTVEWTPELQAVVARAKELHGNLRAMTLLHERSGAALRYRTVNVAWLAATRSAGVTDAQMRDLRAMAGTAADEQGLSAQKLLGHTSETNTKRYLRSKKIPVVKAPSIGQILDFQNSTAKKSSA